MKYTIYKYIYFLFLSLCVCEFNSFKIKWNNFISLFLFYIYMHLFKYHINY